MKQHRDTIHRDLDDEVAEAIEHQYAGRLVKGVARGDSTAKQAADTAPRERSREDESGDEEFDKQIEQLREKSGF